MSDTKKSPTPVIKSSAVYDVLKYIAQIFLPALGTLYFAMAGAWGWTNGTQVVGTIVAVDTFLGILLHISNVQYTNSGKYAGEMVVTSTSGGGKLFSMELNDDPKGLEGKGEVTFKVVNKSDG